MPSLLSLVDLCLNHMEDRKTYHLLEKYRGRLPDRFFNRRPVVNIRRHNIHTPKCSSCGGESEYYESDIKLEYKIRYKFSVRQTRQCLWCNKIGYDTCTIRHYFKEHIPDMIAMVNSYIWNGMSVEITEVDPSNGIILNTLYNGEITGFDDIVKIIIRLKDVLEMIPNKILGDRLVDYFSLTFS